MAKKYRGGKSRYSKRAGSRRATARRYSSSSRMRRSGGQRRQFRAQTIKIQFVGGPTGNASQPVPALDPNTGRVVMTSLTDAQGGSAKKKKPKF